MRLKPEQLDAQLKRELTPIYMVSGDEILLVQEACDAIRNAARQAGFNEREMYHADNHLDWGQVYESAQSGSLFADRKIIELHFSNGKFSDAAVKFLSHYCMQPSSDNLLLIRSSRLDKKLLSSKWAKACEDVGVHVQVWPVEIQQLPRWIEQRLKARNFTIATDALQLLSERVEGNLLAAHQEIEKLRILSNASHLDLEEINRCVVDSARFSLFDLVDECLKGAAPHALRILEGLRGEGVEPVLILWALARELRSLGQMRQKLDAGQSLDALLNHPSIPKKRAPALRRAIHQHSLDSLLAMTSLLRHCDAAIKGGGGNAWDILTTACLQLSGQTQAAKRLNPAS